MPDRLPEAENNSNDDASIFSFIVRLWREEPGVEKRQAVWRGHITPVSGNERHYFTDINEIPGFIASYLKEQG